MRQTVETLLSYVLVVPFWIIGALSTVRLIERWAWARIEARRKRKREQGVG